MDSRVPRFQGSRVARLHGLEILAMLQGKVPSLQGGFRIFKIAGFHGSRVPGSIGFRDSRVPGFKVVSSLHSPAMTPAEPAKKPRNTIELELLQLIRKSHDPSFSLTRFQGSKLFKSLRLEGFLVLRFHGPAYPYFESPKISSFKGSQA